ncbi:MAG: 5-dehydro-4-deoxy-D-glucuronate isomerase, partial [Synergistaceae bacterium]|nr:5-dehydro-4-deoxy-D-glucuronate isomerase [Synergistaceae bacterium]
MDIRYSCSPNDVKRYTTEELRREFLITGLYSPDKVNAVYSHVDRMVTVGIMPASRMLAIDDGIDVWKNFGTHYFLERRDAGIF